MKERPVEWAGHGNLLIVRLQRKLRVRVCQHHGDLPESALRQEQIWSHLRHRIAQRPAYRGLHHWALC
jgi:hypothetical protein